MKTLIFSAIALSSLIASFAFAEETKPDNEVSFNLGATSDYRYRGISQTRLQPALQGGADYVNNPNSFYMGAWFSTISWIKDIPNGGNTPLEIDLYLGKRGEITKDVSYDIGVLSYVYNKNNLGHLAGFANAATTEIYGQIGYGPAYFKYSRSVTDLFGNPDSKNSGYLDVGANIDLGNDYTLNLHAGNQKVTGPNSSAASYNDYKIGISKVCTDLKGATVSIAAIGTNGDRVFYASPANGKNLAKSSIVVAITASF